MKTINWSATKEEHQLLVEIAQRAVGLNSDYSDDFQGLMMDITACHLNGNPLKLEELLKTDDFNFMHDINGINRFIDRNNGELTQCFLPRLSKQPACFR